MFVMDEVLLPADAVYKIGDLAEALDVSAATIDRWTKLGLFPETCFWLTGLAVTGNRRRYTKSMIDAAVEVARQMGLLGKRRWNLRESDYGLRVSGVGIAANVSVNVSHSTGKAPRDGATRIPLASSTIRIRN